MGMLLRHGVTRALGGSAVRTLNGSGGTVDVA